MKLTQIPVQEMLDAVNGQVTDEDVARASEDPQFPPEVRARLKASTHNALANIEVINERMGVDRRRSIGRRLGAVLNDNRSPAWIRLRKVNALLDEHNSFNGENVACRKGCAHCCYIPVSLSETEAQMIGMAIGRKPKKNVATFHDDPDDIDTRNYGYHTPCPFLKDNQCSIYEHRPVACRKLVNADIDDLLCRLLAPRAPPVPYMNLSEFDLATAMIAENHKTADIREFFPPERK